MDMSCELSDKIKDRDLVLTSTLTLGCVKEMQYLILQLLCVGRLLSMQEDLIPHYVWKIGIVGCASQHDFRSQGFLPSWEGTVITRQIAASVRA